MQAVRVESATTHLNHILG